MQNPGYNPGYPPQKSGPPWGWIIGIGCGPITPNPVHFKLQYQYEDSAWKLSTIDVNTKR
jgi:hypothetical protein